MSKIENIRNALRFGMLLFRLQDRLGRAGIRIEPYYWMQEGVTECNPPVLEGRPDDYSLSFFGNEEMKTIGSILPQYPEHNLLARLKKGQKCFGLKYKDEIAAFMWFEFDRCSDQGIDIILNNQEAYLWDMFSLKQFRGKNIAPYLRYHSYQVLKSIGKYTFYSASDYFNAPSIRYKKKLNAKCIWLGLNVTLFSNYHRHWILKKYNH